MASNHLYNFQELLVHGVLDSNTLYHKIAKLRIPQIQRSYAQGRKSESDISWRERDESGQADAEEYGDRRTAASQS
jgi:hypothetical protein